jgi:hypothetical protein
MSWHWFGQPLEQQHLMMDGAFGYFHRHLLK